jgi:head-tail adaptor
MSETIGAMRARVRLERPLRAPDDLGGGAITWTNEGDVWAAVAAGAVGQTAAFDTNFSIGSLTLTINRCADIRPGWRVVWGARVLRIVGVRDEGAARIDLICEEERL